MTELRTGPLYFFDQPTRRNRVRWIWRNLLHVNGAEGAQLERSGHSDHERQERESERLTGETGGPGPPDAPSSARGVVGNTEDHNDAYKRAAPRLLHELALLLWQHSRGEGSIPHGVVNILNYSWQDLTAGIQDQAQVVPGSRCGHELGGSVRQGSADGRKEPAEGNSEKHPQLSSDPRVKRRKDKCSRAAHGSSSVCFSISSSSWKDPGWIIQPSCDEPQQITVCQWVVKRLQEARNPESFTFTIMCRRKLQTAGRKQKTPLILCHYGDTKAKVKNRRARRKSQPAIYPSGCVAVCQSHSGLPCGGFYTNVFSDSERPVIMATITAFGRGAVTRPLRFSIEAVWDQDGGFICDHDGNKRKEWRWQTNVLKEKIVIQVKSNHSNSARIETTACVIIWTVTTSFVL